MNSTIAASLAAPRPSKMLRGLQWLESLLFGHRAIVLGFLAALTLVMGWFAAQLRMDAGSHPDDPRVSALVGELSVKSEEFRLLWAAHDVEEKCRGVQRLHHPLVGELELRVEAFHLADDHEQMLLTYHAEPGSPSAEALRLLASWGTDATRAEAGMPPRRMA